MLKDKLLQVYQNINADTRKRLLFLAVLTFLGVVIIFTSYYFPENFFVTEGQVSPATIEARQTVTFEDTVKTEANRRLAASKIGDIYVFDSTVIERQSNQINQIFKVWEELMTLPEEERTAAAAPYIDQFQIKPETAQTILNLDSITLQAIKSEAIAILSEEWRKGVREGEVETARKNVLDEVYLRFNQSDYVSFIQSIYRFLDLEANYIFDEAATEEAKEEAAQKEPPVLTTIYRNQKIIGKGEVVTQDHITILKALGYQRSKQPYIMVLGMGLFTLGVFFSLAMFLKQFRLIKLIEGNQMQLLALLFLTELLIARLIMAINFSAEPGLAELVAYLIPASTGAILVALLLDKRLGLFFAAVISFYVGIMADGSVDYAVVSFVGSIAGMYAISRFSQRTDWVKAALSIAVMNSAIIVTMGLINNSTAMVMIWSVVMGCINGFLSPILAYGSLPFLESSFKITTSISLMELANPGQPLLKELLLKAPGTYNHSILVGNLAESAADVVGADPILVRVGAYYHDIGKTRRPYFFIENQLGESNPHEKLTPALSALILSSHVKDGIEIGRKGRLPQVVLDFIAQHHGTGIMGYFYHKAVEEAGDVEKVKESDFRYGGPKPQSKEVALVMLADSVEAAIRSMNVSGDKLEAAVKKIIQDKLNDGQLEDSNLTLQDLKQIGQSFTQVLNGIYHSRIEYPENVIEAMKKGMNHNAADNQQPAAEDQDRQSNAGDSEGSSENQPVEGEA